MALASLAFEKLAFEKLALAKLALAKLALEKLAIWQLRQPHMRSRPLTRAVYSCLAWGVIQTKETHVSVDITPM